MRTEPEDEKHDQSTPVPGTDVQATAFPLGPAVPYLLSDCAVRKRHALWEEDAPVDVTWRGNLRRRRPLDRVDELNSHALALAFPLGDVLLELATATVAVRAEDANRNRAHGFLRDDVRDPCA